MRHFFALLLITAMASANGNVARADADADGLIRLVVETNRADLPAYAEYEITYTGPDSLATMRSQITKTTNENRGNQQEVQRRGPNAGQLASRWWSFDPLVTEMPTRFGFENAITRLAGTATADGVPCQVVEITRPMPRRFLLTLREPEDKLERVTERWYVDATNHIRRMTGQIERLPFPFDADQTVLVTKVEVSRLSRTPQISKVASEHLMPAAAGFVGQRLEQIPIRGNPVQPPFTLERDPKRAPDAEQRVTRDGVTLVNFGPLDPNQLFTLLTRVPGQPYGAAQYDEDAPLLEAFCRRRGYGVRLWPGQLSSSGKSGHFEITLNILPITHMTFHLEEGVSKEAVLAALPLRPGDYYNLLATKNISVVGDGKPLSVHVSASDADGRKLRVVVGEPEVPGVRRFTLKLPARSAPNE